MKMQYLLDRIAQKTDVHSQLPFYRFLQNTSVSPQDRMAFAPCFTFFVMSFSDLNRQVLREEPTIDPIQAMINDHSYGDEDHWIWFLEDICKLNYDVNATFAESMRFLWSDETMVQRKVSRWMLQTAAMAKPIHRLVFVEAIESIAGVFLSTTRDVAVELRSIDQRDCRYFGNMHSMSDEGHEMHTDEMSEFIGNLPLTDDESEEALRLIDETFEMFADLVSDLLAHAKVPKIVNGTFVYTYEMRTYNIRKVKPLGAYLVESGLLSDEKLNWALTEQRKTGQRLGDVVSDHGWVNKHTIEYMIEKLVMPERQNDRSFITEEASKTEASKTLVAV